MFIVFVDMVVECICCCFGYFFYVVELVGLVVIGLVIVFVMM